MVKSKLKGLKEAKLVKDMSTKLTSTTQLRIKNKQPKPLKSMIP